MCEDASDKYICAIIRKPQAGKTFICLENIRSNRECYHLIITMNNIKSNLQFYERARKRLGNDICVFNSREKKKDHNTDFLHAKNVGGVKKHLRDGAKIVIMCAHPKRFDASILDILEEIEDSHTIRKSVVIHIDEAHAYVPTWRDNIVAMNNYEITQRIYMYSATPFAIWSPVHQLFENIYIVDCEKEFDVIKSGDYFGVTDCQYIVDQMDYTPIEQVIPKEFIERWGNDLQRSNAREGKVYSWGSPGPFDQGNEIQLLSYTDNTLKRMRGSGIRNDAFSYNFVPGFCRKLTSVFSDNLHKP